MSVENVCMQVFEGLSNPYVWIIMSLSIGIIGVPLKMSRPITFTRLQGLRVHHEITDFDRCITVAPHVPSVIQLDSNQIVGMASVYKYQLVSYSSDNCDDGHVVSHFPMEASTPITLNGRTPICSYKLGKNPLKPINVIFFTPEGKRGSFNTITNSSRCAELCTSDKDQLTGHSVPYPLSVEILEEDGKIANNFVELFSGKGCMDDDRMSYNSKSSKAVEIISGTNLINLTMKSRDAVVVRSISITYEKKIL